THHRPRMMTGGWRTAPRMRRRRTTRTSRTPQGRMKIMAIPLMSMAMTMMPRLRLPRMSRMSKPRMSKPKMSRMSRTPKPRRVIRVRRHRRTLSLPRPVRKPPRMTTTPPTPISPRRRSTTRTRSASAPLTTHWIPTTTTHQSWSTKPLFPTPPR
ncbi:hypothetical protein BGX30_008765, partial [Mortierella sp. GBA39]